MGRIVGNILVVQYTPELAEFAKNLVDALCQDKPKEQWVQLELFPELKESESDKQRG